MGALSDIVKQGKALYVGLSNYDAKQLKEAAKILKDNGTPLLIVQPFYNMLERWAEESGLLDAAAEVGAGVICYSPLAQGVLTDRYLDGIPKSPYGPGHISNPALVDMINSSLYGRKSLSIILPKFSSAEPGIGP